MTRSGLFPPLGGSADNVLSQIAAQRKRAAGLMDAKAQLPEKQHSQPQTPFPLLPSPPNLQLPEINLPDIHSHPSLAASDVHSRRVSFSHVFGENKPASSPFQRTDASIPLGFFVEDGVKEETSVRKFLHIQKHVAHPDPLAVTHAQASYWAWRLSVLCFFPPSLEEQRRLQQRNHNG